MSGVWDFVQHSLQIGAMAILGIGIIAAGAMLILFALAGIIYLFGGR
jgi:hypothetical protein